VKVVLDLPEWVKEKTVLWIIGGTEPIAYYVRGKWYVKEGRCSRCGRCCGPCPHLIIELDKTTSCGHPKNDFEDIPWSCVRGCGGDKIPECTASYREVG
jgi:Fe-S-cluster-containing hydrogenase component 2